MRLRRTILILGLAAVCTVITAQRISERIAGAELAKLLSKPSPVFATLTKPWVGQTKVAFRSENWPIPSGSNRREGESLVLDKFCFWETTAANSPGAKTLGTSIGTDSVTMQHTYRTSLPLDAAILQAKTEGDLVAVLGQPHHPSDLWSVGETMHTSAGWRFFSLSERTLLQTLSVHCLLKQSKGESDWQVEGIELRRGTATPLR